MLNVKAVCKLARAYDVPVVLSTVGVDMGVNTGTIDELRAELPDVPEIDRTGVNSWEDPDFRAAVEATGRKKIVMCGLDRKSTRLNSSHSCALRMPSSA